jgi:D-3-phosphoglycerate dehydrogenase / 2-oxoglutarate reductase
MSATPERILVTPRSLTAEPHREVERMREAGFDIVYSTPGKTPSEDELISLVPDCVGWLAGVEPVSERVIAAASRLRVISRNGVGTDNLPIPVLQARGIAVAIAEGANSMGVAELAIGLMFSALRAIPQADAGIKQGAWPRRRGIEIHGRTVGVVGCGAIGREVARMAAGLGANVVGFDPAEPELGLSPERFRFASLDALLSASDVVTLHCPMPRSGAALIDAKALAGMKAEAVLINTARAGLVNETALKSALDEGRLFAYATDVFSEEPPKERAIADHPRVIATSHIGGFTEESVDRATSIAAANILRHLRSDARMPA